MEEILSFVKDVLKDVGPTVKAIFADILPEISSMGGRVLPTLIEIVGKDHPILRIGGIALAVMILYILFMLFKLRKFSTSLWEMLLNHVALTLKNMPQTLKI